MWKMKFDNKKENTLDTSWNPSAWVPRSLVSLVSKSLIYQGYNPYLQQYVDFNWCYPWM